MIIQVDKLFSLQHQKKHPVPVKALRRLMEEGPQPGNAPLFRIVPSFSRPLVVSVLKARLKDLGISDKSRGAAQHAADNRMLDESIQRLGRWTSNSFQLYFKTSPATLFHLNLSFQKGKPLAVPRFVHHSTPIQEPHRLQKQGSDKPYQSPHPPLPTSTTKPATSPATTSFIGHSYGQSFQPGQAPPTPASDPQSLFLGTTYDPQI